MTRSRFTWTHIWTYAELRKLFRKVDFDPHHPLQGCCLARGWGSDLVCFLVSFEMSMSPSFSLTDPKIFLRFNEQEKVRLLSQNIWSQTSICLLHKHWTKSWRELIRIWYLQHWSKWRSENASTYLRVFVEFDIPPKTFKKKMFQKYWAMDDTKLIVTRKLIQN